MARSRDLATSKPGGAARDDRLDSWKEIAAYLGRGIRTVQRWERDEGLPVHRLAHDKRGSIYARREELAAWWESRRITLASQPAADGAGATPGVAPAATRPSRLVRVTQTSAMTSWPVLSSDARLIAYVSDAGDGLTPQIWIQQIGGAALRLTNRARDYQSAGSECDLWSAVRGLGINGRRTVRGLRVDRNAHAGVPDRHGTGCHPG